MCTLTYLLNNNGYELFFNRDEQRSRLLATPPKYHPRSNAIYPVDPVGGGTWIAVSKKGLALALLNNYQAPPNTHNNVISRGQLILTLLQGRGSIIAQLKTMNLHVFQPFQLCVFPEDLSINKPNIHCVKWNGKQLIEVSVDVEADLPITSSSIDFIAVRQNRKHRFERLVDGNKPLSKQHKDFHFSTEKDSKYSVNMQRKDARTVSISHLSVKTCLVEESEICFKYFDNVVQKSYTTSSPKEKNTEFAQHF
ncbi:NRDE family protein [Colwellia hornerae]|uniref:NRDE family protein n=1 Tax=Colwellia hornerae TaxID=89402 RepID=A0A5C6Q2L0_9GAMM|nr:NRDE family protein [Colwellia hornerae]TWX46549.1 NRDE family protein [Colwellia hornerae]TWX54297.1 NRDE family protein [Colwellia hornerae]TWX63074.1 NRDE family protein [Colwellia hornerae]